MKNPQFSCIQRSFYPVDAPLAIAGDDREVTAEQLVGPGVAGIDQQGLAAQGVELALQADYDDIFPAHFLDHLRADLLVAAPEQETLPADRRDHDPGGVVCQQRQQLALADIRGDQPLAGDHVHANQRLWQAQPGR